MAMLYLTIAFHVLSSQTLALVTPYSLTTRGSSNSIAGLLHQRRWKSTLSASLPPISRSDENDSDDNDDQNSQLMSDIAKRYKSDKGLTFSPSSATSRSDSDKRRDEAESISPINDSTKPKRLSRRKGSKARMKRPIQRMKIDGDDGKSILPPPPTSDNEQFPDRSKFQRKRSNRPSRGGRFGPVGSRKFKPRKDKIGRFGAGGRGQWDRSTRSSGRNEQRSSLLPLSEQTLKKNSTSNATGSALPSWDEFFSKSPIEKDSKRKGRVPYNVNSFERTSNTKSRKIDDDESGIQDYFEKSLDRQIEKINELPPPSYLFGESTSKSEDKTGSTKDVATVRLDDDFQGVANGSNIPTAYPSLDGVLPVSELFYRSTQSISVEHDDDDDAARGKASKDIDDEELPFSAEQSDKILSTNNKIIMRRNRALKPNGDDDKAQYKTDLAKLRASSGPIPSARYIPGSRKNRRKRGGKFRNEQRNNGSGKGRKMVRRGMEMLVGGEPINADPPLRFMELNYCFQTADAISAKGLNHDLEKRTSRIKDSDDFFSVITSNSRDFGPLLQKTSVSKVSTFSRELYCEHFVKSSIKWNICPNDLKAVVSKFETYNSDNSPAVRTYDDLVERISSVNFNSEMAEIKPDGKLPNLQVGVKGLDMETSTVQSRNQHDGSGEDYIKSSYPQELNFTLGGELKFTLGISPAELESGNNEESSGSILRRVLGKGIASAIRIDSIGFEVGIAKLMLNEVDEGATEFNVEFNMSPKETMRYDQVERAAKKINAALSQAMNDGDMALAIGSAAKSELAWIPEVRDRVVEEFFFDEDITDNEGESRIGNVLDTLDDEDDFEAQRDSEEKDLPKSKKTHPKSGKEFDGPFGMPGDTIYAKDDIFLGGGNGGVFPDYSENGKNSAPFKGELGPILLDAAIQRAVQRQPRVIAIGDVHGCIDELQSLLRRCDYSPGDLIVFLGDLVSKGPDSLSVVQMARELGAIGVRGNHDFEVIRWHQAIKSGADPPVIGSEHYQIASTLSKADLRWMYSFPWYLSSKELNALFVHAGFVSGIRLGKQNPRLMMNMRSILPDGTVTSKFFNNWPWARLWDGPQTVLFGHDADRGLQQYEHAIGLDTGCVYGGRLTACILPEKRLVSVNAKREYFQYRRKHFD